MVGKILRMAAYAKAPIHTFTLMHPMRALKLGATYLVVRKALGMRRRSAERYPAA